MSDGLIERLRACISDADSRWWGPDGVAMRGKFLEENEDAILSALKTVRGIEGLANPFSLNIRVFSEGAVFVTTNKGTFQAETLPLAVEAAVEAAGKKQ